MCRQNWVIIKAKVKYLVLCLPMCLQLFLCPVCFLTLFTLETSFFTPPCTLLYVLLNFTCFDSICQHFEHVAYAYKNVNKSAPTSFNYKKSTFKFEIYNFLPCHPHNVLILFNSFPIISFSIFCSSFRVLKTKPFLYIKCYFLRYVVQHV